MGKQKYNWQEIKQEFITANLAPGGDGLELKELAHKYGIPINVLWNRSSNENWVKELAQARKEKEIELSKQVQKAAVAIDKGELMKEYRVRSENFKASTKMLGKLMKRWDSLTEEELEKMPPTDLIKGVHICLKAREQAAGLPQVFKLKEPLNVNAPTGETSVDESNLSEAKISEMAKSLSIYLDTKKDEGAIDV